MQLLVYFVMSYKIKIYNISYLLIKSFSIFFSKNLYFNFPQIRKHQFIGLQLLILLSQMSLRLYSPKIALTLPKLFESS